MRDVESDPESDSGSSCVGEGGAQFYACLLPPTATAALRAMSRAAAPAMCLVEMAALEVPRSSA